ncbi:MAG: hypothetical protein JXA30_15665 [Deltaproteobacteria bacterium]|nr:hypothetical protein [Deltaproteobacteria bacterium]
MPGNTHSSLPPEPPASVIVKSRIRSLQNMRELEGDSRRKSVLEYEIASLTEHKRADLSKAIKLYLSAYNLDNSFRPPLFALARIFERRRSFDNLRRIYESAVRVARSDSERASHLIDLALLLYDHLNEPERAVAMLEEALDLDPSPSVAALVLEGHYSTIGELDPLDRIIDIRASRTRDPALKAVLLNEVGQARLKRGDIEGAVEVLRVASTIGQFRFQTLTRLENIARAHDLYDVLAEALQGRAILAGQIALEREQQDETTEAKAPGVVNAYNYEEALGAALSLWRETALVRLAFCNDPAGSAAAYEYALRIAPDDYLLRQERLIAYEKAGEIEAVKQQASAMLESELSGKQAATLFFRLGEAAQAQGKIELAREALTRALQADPTSSAVIGLLEDSRIDAALYQELICSLESRAENALPEEAAEAVWRAGLLAADYLQDIVNASRLLRSAASKARDKAPVLRELFDRALAFGAYPDAIQAGLELSEVVSDEAEQEALLWDCFRITSCEIGDEKKASELLSDGLTRASCRSWAPEVARLVGALQKDYSLLARAHEALAEQAANEEVVAAHLCAAARGLVRAGDSKKASGLLRQALEYSVANGYAVPLLEEILMAQGESEQVVHLLRQAAEAKVNAKQSEIALLYAGAVAEIAGNAELAARNYEDAIDRDPMALAPLWSLRRLAERSGQTDMLTTALEGLAFREAEIDKLATSNFELGIHRDLLGDGARAHDCLQAVLADRDLGTEAALSLLFLAPDKAMDERMQAAWAQLQASLPRDMAMSLLRERIAFALDHDPELAQRLAQELLSEEPGDRWALYAYARTAHDNDDRAQRLVDLGNATDDQEAAASLLLHGLRCHLLAGRREAVEDGLILALGIAELSADATLASVALDEALTPGDDAESRVDALNQRLQHATEEARHAISGAYARALLAASRFEQAAQVARDSISKNEDDIASWEVLHGAAYALGDWRTVVRACDKLADYCDEKFEVLLLEESAELLLVHYQQTEEAEIRLRTALEIDPRREVAFNLLHDIIASRDDVDELQKLLENRILVVDDADELIDLYYEQSRLYRSKGERKQALATLEKLLSHRPNHIGALGLKAEIHASLEDWAEAIIALRRLAETDIPLEQKLLAWIGAADLLEKKQADPQAAYEELEKVAFAELGNEQTYAKMAELAGQLGKALDAAGALVLAAEKCTGGARAAYERRAGHIYAEQLNDRKSAIEAYLRALAADPIDDAACQAVIDLIIDPIERNEVLEAFESKVRERAKQDPQDDLLFRKLYKTAIWRDEPDMQLLMLQRLVEMKLATGEEQRAYETLARNVPPSTKGKLAEASLARLMPGPNPADLAEICRLASEAVMEMNLLTPPGGDNGPLLRVKAREPNPARDALGRLMGVFGVKIREFFLGGADPKAVAALPGTGTSYDWVVGSEVDTPLSAPQRYAVGYQAMAIRLGVFPLLTQASSDEAFRLISAVAAALDLPLAASDPSEREERVRAEAHAISRRTRKSLRIKLAELEQGEERLREYCAVIHRSCQRAGLLVAVSLQSVLEIVLKQNLGTRAFSEAPEAQELVEFYTSRELLALRREIGMAL